MTVLPAQDQGLALHLKKATLQWSSDAPTSTLWGALLLHDVVLTPGGWFNATLRSRAWAG